MVHCQTYDQTECLNHDECGWCISDSMCSIYDPCRSEILLNNGTCTEFILSNSTKNCRTEMIDIIVLSGTVFIITLIVICCAWNMLSRFYIKSVVNMKLFEREYMCRTCGLAN